MAVVRFSVTGPNVPALRAAARVQMAHLDPAAKWDYDLDVTPAVRPENGGVISDWTGEVQAWDGHESTPVWVTMRERGQGLSLLED